MQNLDPIEHWCSQVLPRGLARELLRAIIIPFPWSGYLCARGRKNCVRSHRSTLQKRSFSSLHFMLLESKASSCFWGCDCVKDTSIQVDKQRALHCFHYSHCTPTETRVPTLRVEKCLLVRISSQNYFFLVTECICKGWGQLWHWSEAILKKWKCNALLVMRRCVPELSAKQEAWMVHIQPRTCSERLTLSLIKPLTFTTFLQACNLGSIRKACSPQHFANMTRSLISGKLSTNCYLSLLFREKNMVSFSNMILNQRFSAALLYSMS